MAVVLRERVHRTPRTLGAKHASFHAEALREVESYHLEKHVERFRVLTFLCGMIRSWCTALAVTSIDRGFAQKVGGPGAGERTA